MNQHELNEHDAKLLTGEIEVEAADDAPARIMDVELEPEATMSFETEEEESAFIFLLENGAIVNGAEVAEKTVITLDANEKADVTAKPDSPVRVLVFSGLPTEENELWEEPIIMDVSDDFAQAFTTLQSCNFTRCRPGHEVPKTGGESFETADGEVKADVNNQAEEAGHQPEQGWTAGPDTEDDKDNNK